MATSVSASTTATSLIGVPTGQRKSVGVYYDGAAILYLLAGEGTPSSSNYTAKLGDGFLTYYETPTNYHGPLSGVWSAATGAAQVTEYV